MLILGIDPGLGTTGWGIIRAEGNRLAHVGNGRLRTDTAAPLSRPLAPPDALLAALTSHPAPASPLFLVVFANTSPPSTLTPWQAPRSSPVAQAAAGTRPGTYHSRMLRT